MHQRSPECELAARIHGTRHTVRMDAAVLTRLNNDCARMCDSALDAYLVACEELVTIRDAAKEGPIPPERISTLRALGAEVGSTITELHRLIDEVVRAEAGVFPEGMDPRTAQPVLRALGDSFVLLLAVREPADIDRLPFADPILISDAMRSPALEPYLSRHSPDAPAT